MSHLEQEQIFTKRTGTTDRGKDYEHLYIAHLILKLLTNDSVQNFYLSSNDKNYGSFDDVVVEIKYTNKNETDTYAIQLKHSKNKALSTNDLTAPKGNFSIKEYSTDFYKNIKPNTKSVKLVLFTNRSARFDNKIEVKLEDGVLEVDLKEESSNQLLNTSFKENCHVFISRGDEFLDNLVLYTGQANVDQLEKQILESFKRNFSGDDSTFQDFLNFIIKWSIQEGKKRKLDKEWMKRVVTLCVLTPHIKPLTFSTKRRVSEKERILREIVSKFQVTTFKKENFEKIRNLWVDVLVDDLDKINQMRTKYQINIDRIKSSDDLSFDDINGSKLAWLLGRSPLVIDCTNDEVLKLCDDNFVLLGHTTFNKLQLVNLEIYEEFKKTFTYSIEGQREAALENLLDEEINLMSTDQLAEMLEGPLLIGKQTEVLPPCHVNRSLSKILIGLQFLKKRSENTVIAISGVENLQVFKEFSSEIRTIDFPELDAKNEKRIIVSKREIDVGKYVKSQTVHTFKFLDEDYLELIGSTNFEELKNFRSDGTSTTIDEAQFLHSDKLINIVCANPGMGKSTLVKSLKNKSDSTTWTLIIYAKDHGLYFRQNPEADFLKYIIEENCKNCKDLDATVLKRMMEENRIRLIWDGLDETSDLTLEVILNSIQEISQKGIPQTLTSRNSLKEKLEDRFHTFSRSLTQFDETEQKKYIQDRLKLSGKELSEIFNKIRANIRGYSNNDILGIPLQIFMLTELFRQDKNKYLKLLNEIFTVLDLYEFFVQEKFNIFYREKREYNLKIDQNFEKCEKERKERIDSYKNLAYNLYFENRLARFFNIFRYFKNEPLDEFKSKGDPVGFISKVTSDNYAEFSHNSFGEYFAALYLFDYYPRLSQSGSFISNSRCTNIRFFLDLMLGKNSKAHVAVLCRSSIILQKCTEDDLNQKDSIGRQVIELACAWGKKYQLVREKPGFFGFSFNLNLVSYESSQTLPISSSIKKFQSFENRIFLPLKKLILLLPFLIQLYNKGFERDQLPTIFYYSIRLDCGIIFDCIPQLSSFGYFYSSIDDSNFLSLVVLSKAYNVLERFMLDKKNQHKLLRHLEKLTKLFEVPQLDFYTFLVNLRDENGRTLLHYACKRHSFETVKLLVDLGSDVNAVDENGKVPMIHLFENYNDKLKIAEFLVEKGALVDVPDSKGRLPLHYSLEKEVKVAEFLIKNGAKCETPDVNGLLPIHVALKAGYLEAVRLLIERNVDLEAPDLNKRRPVEVAFEKNYFEAVKLMSERGISLDFECSNGQKTIHYACEHSYIDLTELLLKKGIDCTLPDKFGNTPMFYALKNNHYMIVQLLTDSGIDPNSVKIDDEEPIHHATTNGHSEIVQILVKNGAKIDSFAANGLLPIHSACKLGLGASIYCLLENGAKFDSPDGNNKLPIHYLCTTPFSVFVIIGLLEIGVDLDLNVVDGCGRTPLHYVCESEGCVEVFIELGARVDSVDDQGQLPLHLACQNTNSGYEMVEVLLNNSSPVDVKDLKGRTPLFYACENSYYSYSILKMLIEKEAKVDVRDWEGQTPLHLACKTTDASTVELLITKMENVNVADVNGVTPLHVACEESTESVVRLLLDSGAVDVEDKIGRKAIHYAARNQAYYASDIIRFLTDKVDVNVSDFNEWTALHHACEAGRLQTIEILSKMISSNVVNNEGRTPLDCVFDTERRDKIVKFGYLKLSQSSALDETDLNNCN